MRIAKRPFAPVVVNLAMVGVLSMVMALGVPWLAEKMQRRRVYVIGLTLYVLSAVFGIIGGVFSIVGSIVGALIGGVVMLLVAPVVALALLPVLLPVALLAFIVWAIARSSRRPDVVVMPATHR